MIVQMTQSVPSDQDTADAVNKPRGCGKPSPEDPWPSCPGRATLDIEPTPATDTDTACPTSVKLFVKETKAENGVLKSGG